MRNHWYLDKLLNFGPPTQEKCQITICGQQTILFLQPFFLAVSFFLGPGKEIAAKKKEANNTFFGWNMTAK